MYAIRSYYAQLDRTGVLAVRVGGVATEDHQHRGQHLAGEQRQRDRAAQALGRGGLAAAEVAAFELLEHDRPTLVPGPTGQAFAAAEDWERAGSLILSKNSEILKRGEVSTVIRWFQALPEEILLTDPKLCFDYCWPLLLAGKFAEARPLLEQVEGMAAGIPEILGEVV